MTRKIAILASGNGTNAEQIIRHFSGNDLAEVSLVLSNRKDAFVLERAKKYDVPSRVFSRDELMNGEVRDILLEHEIDLVVLAGFLWLIPKNLIDAFPDRILNIHPALLPKYGGKGMYGARVHEAVRENGDRESGVTIHLVNERYDEGNILLQAHCAILPEDTAEDIAQKVHLLEYQYYPQVIESMVKNL